MALDTRTLAADIGSVCATFRELDGKRDADLAVDGILPPLWCEPASAGELAGVLKLANEHGAAVMPRGGGSRMGLGMPPRSADLLVSTRALQRVVEYEPADMTITVEAGLGLNDLQQRLNAEGQFLALDPPSADRATIGGIVASNASGPIRLQYGSARDLVIGTRVANADGVLTKAGGRVVKNVAGYDLNKLYTGSLGTLGVIVELSFKLHPLPQRRGTVLTAFDDLDACASVVKRLMRSAFGPSALEVLNPAAARAVPSGLDVSPRGWLLAVLVSGFEKAVLRATEEIAALCRDGGRAEIRPDDADSGKLWGAIRDLADSSDSSRPLLKFGMPPSRSLEALEHLRWNLDRRGCPATLVAQAGTGLVYGRLEPSEWSDADLDQLAALVRDLRAFAVERGGSLVLESCPVALKERVDVWGEVGPSLDLMRSLKEKLDPRGTLNRGRYVGGI
jgi:glycolate oxidase FAD binding subunit